MCASSYELGRGSPSKALSRAWRVATYRSAGYSDPTRYPEEESSCAEATQTPPGEGSTLGSRFRPRAKGCSWRELRSGTRKHPIEEPPVSVSGDVEFFAPKSPY